MKLFSSAELAQIEGAIAAAERQSAGEIVVAVVQSSVSYDLPRALSAAGWALCAAFAAQLLVPGALCGWILLGQIPVALTFWFVLGWPPLLRRLVRPAQVDVQTRARAYQLFAQRGVHRTRDKSGLLIMISLVERRVIILGDDGIHAHIGEAGWERYVEAIVAGIKAGKPAAALISVINSFGALLAEKFPRRADDTNELPDQVVLQP